MKTNWLDCLVEWDRVLDFQQRDIILKMIHIEAFVENEFLHTALCPFTFSLVQVVGSKIKLQLSKLAGCNDAENEQTPSKSFHKSKGRGFPFTG
jgi:hypothetical protein